MAPPKKGPFSGRRIVPVQSTTNYFDRFFVVTRKSESNETFQTVSPFLVQKAVTATVGEVTSIKKMRSGDLLVEVNSRKQAQQMQKLKALASISISVKPHNSLNMSKGVITCGELLNIPVDEIVHEMKSQGVVDVRRITIWRDGQRLETKHHILTFKTTNLPEFAYAGYIKLPVRPYIPNPLRCFQCQRFGHSKANCRGSLTCARCAEKGHDSQQCDSKEKCVNCNGDHPSYSRICQPLTTKTKTAEKITESDTEQSMNSIHETPAPPKPKRKSKSKSQTSLTLNLAKRGLSGKDIPLKLKKSTLKNSVALGLATQGVAHKDLTSIFGGISNNPDIKLHPSEDESELDMSFEDQATPANVSTHSPSKTDS
ncbi:uncharacterized protein LOC129958449 [Argiope bruennichi]|uniref:uncharacterized protein LOC129958449 n=1 Tax=Argiope bruennichi TaxID=94029 RepID=UPI0024950BE2|nr:uncharacterized protein LOC129958449 [Argiope bruennichi]